MAGDAGEVADIHDVKTVIIVADICAVS